MRCKGAGRGTRSEGHQRTRKIWVWQFAVRNSRPWQLLSPGRPIAHAPRGAPLPPCAVPGRPHGHQGCKCKREQAAGGTAGGSSLCGRASRGVVGIQHAGEGVVVDETRRSNAWATHVSRPSSLPSSLCGQDGGQGAAQAQDRPSAIENVRAGGRCFHGATLPCFTMRVCAGAFLFFAGGFVRGVEKKALGFFRERQCAGRARATPLRYP